jgi:PAS domain S-box-containing protein
VFFNRKAREWHGLGPLDSLQSEWPELYDLYEADGVTPVQVDRIPLVRAFCGEIIKDVGLVIAAKNQPLREVLCNGSRLMKEDGHVAGAVIVMNDITGQKKMMRELRERESQLREAHVIAGMGSYSLDVSTGLWKSSPELRQILGIDETHDHSVQGWLDMIHSGDRAMVVADFQDTVLGGHQVFDKVYRIVRPNDQAERVVHGFGRLEFDGTGNLTKMVGLIQDITDQHQTEEALRKFRTAVHQSANTIVMTDPEGRIEYVNPAFENSTGYTAAEVLGQNPRVLKSGSQDKEFYRELWFTISSGNTWRGEFQNRRKDGGPYWESATITPILDAKGEITHHIAIKENITDRKTLEANLLEALDHAEAASRAKSDFLAVMSHELRTPLNGVLGFAELLSDSPIDEEQRECVQIITNSGNHLLAVVNDILDFSNLEKGRMILETSPFAVADLLETSIAAVRKAAADKGLDFQCHADPATPGEILGDERRIRQILINLLGNAVKFTARGSVRLDVSPSNALDRPSLDFSVADTGIGLSPEMLGLIFKPFTQADSTLHRQFQGTGLGLSISQRLAQAMGGLVTVVSTPAEGSTFTLHLPLEVSECSAPVAVAERPLTCQLPQTRRVLVVDDDASNRQLAVKMLESLGYRAEFASDGAQAVAAFAPGKFFVILMDVRMPVLDGFAATGQIRELEASSSGHVPIIALTANVMPGHRERCLAAGMDGFLSKPFRRAELEEKLASPQKNGS